MTFRVEKIPKYRIAYKRRIGPYGTENGVVMENLKKWAEEKNLFKSSILFAIPQDNPAITPPENCRFDACIVISDDYQLDESIYEGELLGGTYFIYVIEHTAQAIQKAYTDVFPVIQEQGYQMDHNKPILERYTNDMKDNPYCDICVPIKL
ncbi:AraC family transcriptional regulator [Ornithinibacillus scapharcae]|uniref:AraC family transcriptional regulator n=1 Tax=Ornithinibacillus scapharcae TaxID=1147159 RepID=UPI000225B822|nr:GyrI-like domain-containing protein [Ornithinibacillus scapharcae]